MRAEKVSEIILRSETRTLQMGVKEIDSDLFICA